MVSAGAASVALGRALGRGARPQPGHGPARFSQSSGQRRQQSWRASDSSRISLQPRRREYRERCQHRGSGDLGLALEPPPLCQHHDCGISRHGSRLRRQSRIRAGDLLDAGLCRAAPLSPRAGGASVRRVAWRRARAPRRTPSRLRRARAPPASSRGSDSPRASRSSPTQPQLERAERPSGRGAP